MTTALVSQLLQQSLSNRFPGAGPSLSRPRRGHQLLSAPQRTVSNTLAEWLADGTAPTEDSGTWDNDTWNYKTLGTRIKITRGRSTRARSGAIWSRRRR